MHGYRIRRRGFLAGTLGLVLFSTTACGGSTGLVTDSGSTTPRSPAFTASPTAGAAKGTEDSPTLESLKAEVTSKFQQRDYTDSETGNSLPYNVFVPADYDSSESYPLVLYIADSSLVGKAVTAPLSQYGALIWASASEQAKRQSIVVVPEYPSVIIDDHVGYTVTDYVEMTTRLLSAITNEYSVNPTRVYGTGQSMGCMTVMFLAAKHPDLFAAELFVSGQWDISQLTNLAQEKFFYVAAGGDEKASAGQQEVEEMLESAGVSSQSAVWDATWSADQFSTAAAELFAAGDRINFATFATGTVLQVPASSPAQMGGEHMASFEPAYTITAVRDWLFAQSA